jgi:glyoxylase-like metal-dependent hydrolase (beta-lactamase superfamily II)
MSAAPCPELPATVRVVVRDWLNANHVLLLGSEENVLIDAGHVGHADTTLRLVAAELEGRPLHRLVNTHCHSDHMGGNAAVQRQYGCTIEVPEAEAQLVDRWDERALWLGYAGQRAERFRHQRTVRAGEVLRMGDLDWRAVPAPGHDMGALMFWNAGHRILISGDALWRRGFGVVLPGAGWRERLAAARETLLSIRDLAPRVIIPGHGRPFDAVEDAIDASLQRVSAFESDEVRLARHVVKVMLTFSLLELGSMAESALADYLWSVPLYREYDAAYFGLGCDGLAALLVGELTRSGAILRQDGRLTPSAMAQG